MAELPVALVAQATSHLWHATLVLLLLAPAALLLRKAPARYEHRLWLTGLAALALPLNRLSGLLADLPLADAVVVGLEPVSAALASPALVEAETGASPLHLFVATVWLAVALALAARLALAVRAAHTLRRLSRPVDPDLAAAAAAAGLPPDRVWVSGRVGTPQVVGWLRPRIVLPEGLAHDLSTDELRSVLRHEDAHRRRRDPLRMLAARAAAAVLWFYPPVWLLLRRLEATAEYACDEAAAPRRADGEVLATAVARTLRRALDADDASLHPVASLAGGRASLGRRIDRMTHERRYRHMTRYRLILAIALLAAGAGVLLAAPSHVPEPPEAPESRAVEAPEKPEQAKKPAKPAKAEKPEKALKAETAGKELHYRPGFTKYVKPGYPEDLRQAGVEGTVLLIVKIDETGVPVDIAWKKKGEIDKRLVKAALKAMEESRFEPFMEDGKAIPWTYKIPVKFEVE